jgi:hypothetical protein
MSPLRATMQPMNSNPPPRALPPLANRAAQRLQDWERLRDQLKALHAELEYLRLMLKINNGK